LRIIASFFLFGEFSQVGNLEKKVIMDFFGKKKNPKLEKKYEIIIFRQ
jgi:hypothetical protein